MRHLEVATRDYLIENPTHPGLHTHPIKHLNEMYDKKMFTSYARNNTPQAYQILWFYGSKPQQITGVAVIPHY